MQNPEPRAALYTRLMLARRGAPVEDTLARLLASQRTGKGVLPRGLGLLPGDYQQMLSRHFPGLADEEFALTPADCAAANAACADRLDEMADLRKLLVDGRTGRTDTERWMVEIVVAGCLGSDHLWQDLGLWSRADLSKLMHDHFAPLAQANTKDMKWKKFLYKQLCQAEGIYTCRAPSCEVCTDYDHCFGPE